MRQHEEQLQAERISAWYGGPSSDSKDHLTRKVHLNNRSEEPVYNLLIFWVYIQGAAYRTSEELMRNLREFRDSGGIVSLARPVISILAPGKYSTTILADTGFHNATLSIEIAFTDAGGRHLGTPNGGTS